MKEKLIITKKSVKGEDGYRTFSIRIREELTDRLDELSGRTNRSRNDLINLLLTFALENCEVDERE
ncbi:MAG: ribbon-helix-helix protein, CopG family [Oscillospiraceae bacterium]|nr:ribbon-helix-helix protein, CopG family [Oscillospiraceae bacterium]